MGCCLCLSDWLIDSVLCKKHKKEIRLQKCERKNDENNMISILYSSFTPINVKMETQIDEFIFFLFFISRQNVLTFLFSMFTSSKTCS